MATSKRCLPLSKLGLNILIQWDPQEECLGYNLKIVVGAYSLTQTGISILLLDIVLEVLFGREYLSGRYSV